MTTFDHGTWKNWTGIQDRETLRRMLEFLGKAHTLEESQESFLYFFFRSSDPLLYQTAALAMGRHLGTSRKLLDSFKKFCAFRSVDPTQPVSLSGQRSHRRILLALCAAAVAERSAWAPEALALTEAPAAFEDPGFGRSNSSDLATYLLALSYLVGNGYRRPGFRDHADKVLQTMAADTGLALDRVTTQRWGLLLQARSRSPEPLSPEAGVALWSSFLGRLHRSYMEGRPLEFGSAMRLLAQMDELVHLAALLPADWRHRLDSTLPLDPSSADGPYFRHRLFTWSRRERKGNPDGGISGAPPPLNSLFPFLSAPELSSSPTSAPLPLEGDSETNREAMLARALLRLLSRRARWASLAGEQQALAAFLLLDLSQYGGLPSARWNALLESELRLPAIAPGNDLKISVADPVVTILLRLLSLEGPASSSFLESRLLHRIQDDRLLLALLPSRKDPELIPILADAYEHRIRMRLLREPGFSPAAYLYRTLVRDPDPAFYQSLQGVCAGREYQQADGRGVPLEKIISWISRERLSGENAAPSSGNGADTPTENPLPELEDPFLPRLRQCRRHPDAGDAVIPLSSRARSTLA